MGATLSKLWSSKRAAVTGGASGHNNPTLPQQQAASSSSQQKAKESVTPTLNDQAPEIFAIMSDIKKYEITEPWLKTHYSLGEGPFWEEETNTLRFLDIEKQLLLRVDLTAGPSSLTTVASPDISMGCTADIEGNASEFIFGGKYGFGIANKKTGAYRWIKKVWSADEISANKHNLFRGNDGAVDSAGRFWCGFMFDPMVSSWREDGAVFRLNLDGSLDRPMSDIVIPNGTTWNKKDDTMYFADSPTKTIWQFDFDAHTGAITNKRPYFTMPQDERYGKDAVPDGHCLDEEGYMWTALHGGSHVLRISPEGEIVAEIKVPTSQPTCPCFVGEELFITSAGGTSGENGGPVDEYAGCCFKINVGVRGLKRFKFKGGAAVEGGMENGEVVAE